MEPGDHALATLPPEEVGMEPGDPALATLPPLTTVLPPPTVLQEQQGPQSGWMAAAQGQGDAVVAAAALPAVPTLHCSEIIQAVIGKQHEVERFVRVPAEDIPHSTMTKMAMLKNELDFLSSSIGGILERAVPDAMVNAGPPGTAAPPAGGWAVPAVGAQAHGQKAQIWPPGMSATPPAYPAEVPDYPVEMTYGGEGTLPPEYRSGLAEAAPAAVVHPQHSEDHGGPAIFQGFQPPPSYAWSRVAPAEEEAPAARRQPASPEKLPQTPPCPQPVPRPKSLRVSSPPREPCGPAAKLVLAAAMEKLRRCQSSCAQLHAERRGVPTHEVESWCASVTDQLKVLAEHLEEKLEVYRRRSRAKDETIRRLYLRLQAAERGDGEPAERPAAPLRTSGPVEGYTADLTTATVVAATAPAAAGPAAGRALQAEPAPGQGEIPSEGWAAMPRQAPPQSWLVEGYAAGGLQDQGASSPEDLSEETVAAQASAVAPGEPAISPQASPSGSVTRASSSVHLAAEDPPRLLASARANAGRRTADPVLQKCMSRPAERTQQVHLRREVAHLRRRDVDLAGQLRARDQQIEQLTNTMRELQLVTQRQIGLYKRQLHLKDNELHAKQEELNQHVGYAVSAAAVGGAAESGRSGRRHGAQASSASMPSCASPQGPSLAAERRTQRGGVTPRPAGRERGRGHHASGASAWEAPGKKEARECSLGAVPHSPRAKGRGSSGDAAALGHAEAQQGALRRRTSPTPTMAGRSTSADERAKAARRRQEAEATAAAVMAGKAREGQTLRYREMPGTARQRR